MEGLVVAVRSSSPPATEQFMAAKGYSTERLGYLDSKDSLVLFFQHLQICFKTCIVNGSKPREVQASVSQ